MRSVWAIAKNTITQALRLKIAFVFIVLLLIFLPLMSVAMPGDGTVKGKLQTFISYSISLMSLLLCLLTIIISVYSITSDITRMQIYSVLTKPVRRYQVLLGKFLGVILLDAVLLIIFSGIIYSITYFIPKFMDASPQEMKMLENEFYTARGSVKPPATDITKEASQAFNEFMKRIDDEKRNDAEYIDQAKVEIIRAKEIASRSLAPGRQLVWEFKNVSIKSDSPGDTFFVRFKFDVTAKPEDAMANTMWIIGDNRPFKEGKIPQTEVFRFERKDKIRTFHEIEVPVSAIAEDGYLAVGCINPPELNNTVLVFPPDEGIEVLYKAGSFSGNFLKAALLIFFRLIFLAALGIFTGTFLSLPVAVLFCLLVYMTAAMSGFIYESFDTLGQFMTVLYDFSVKPVIRLLPQFDKFNPADHLISARILTDTLITKAAVYMVSLKAALLMVLAILIFNRKEIAKITV